MNEILIHPTYFPSIVQMAVVAQAKKVVLEMEDNYQKQTYRNRAHIAHANGLLMLNVPIKHSKDRSTRLLTKNVRVENNFPWQLQHWKSLQSAYRTSPFFEFYEDELFPLFHEPVEHLMQHNLEIFERLCEFIGIETPIEMSQEYFQHPKQNDLRFLVAAKGHKLPSLSTYTQVLEANHGFLPNLSVLDLLFNEGPNAINYLQQQPLDLNG